jgi:hypothetical protein
MQELTVEILLVQVQEKQGSSFMRSTFMMISVLGTGTNSGVRRIQTSMVLG